jgi:hypothetical protein
MGKIAQDLKCNWRHEVAYMWLICHNWLKPGAEPFLWVAFFPERAYATAFGFQPRAVEAEADPHLSTGIGWVE